LPVVFGGRATGWRDRAVAWHIQFMHLLLPLAISLAPKGHLPTPLPSGPADPVSAGSSGGSLLLTLGCIGLGVLLVCVAVQYARGVYRGRLERDLIVGAPARVGVTYTLSDDQKDPASAMARALTANAFELDPSPAQRAVGERQRVAVLWASRPPQTREPVWASGLLGDDRDGEVADMRRDLAEGAYGEQVTVSAHQPPLAEDLGRLRAAM
jgi:hypothetical protein